MGEVEEFATHCPVCGGLAYMHTWRGAEDEIKVDYLCAGCGREFDFKTADESK